jgi:hypothetical protein
METKTPPPADGPPHCPSAQPGERGSTVLGVVADTPDGPRVAYLDRARPVTDELLALTGPVPPTAVLRFASPCAGLGCRHFDGRDCRLATRIVQLLPPVVDSLPACHLRPECRWWQQEGKAACLRCPQVTTDPRDPSDLLVQVAGPEGVRGGPVMGPGPRPAP